MRKPNYQMPRVEFQEILGILPGQISFFGGNMDQRINNSAAVISPPAGKFLPAEAVAGGKRKNGRQRVAAYIRVSTNLEDQENSFETQEAYFRRLLDQNDHWVCAGIYADYGITGTSGEKRAGFQRILRHCKEGRIDRILCKSISRFARNTKDFIQSLNTLREFGVTIFFEKEGLDTAEDTSSFILTALAAIAQEESQSLSSNIRWSNEKRYPRGNVPNQAIFGYRFTGEILTAESGYRYRAVEVIPEEAAVVRWVFEQAAKGIPYQELARELNRQGIPRRDSAYTRKRKEKPRKGQLFGSIEEGWTDAQIRGMVKNERYTGDVLAQKTFTQDYFTHKQRENRGELPRYLVRNHHPAIISRELFAQVEARRKQRGGCAKGAAQPYVLSGRLICGCCGRFYHVRNVRCHPIWYCPSTVRNNGRILCRNEKVYEKQVIYMLCKAVGERFYRAAAPIPESVTVEDIMSGRYPGTFPLCSGESTFLEGLIERMEAVHRADYGLPDRARLGRQPFSGGTLESGEAAERLAEEYWEEVERDYEIRKRAIQWMKGLPKDREGIREFFSGMAEYTRAFVLSVTVRDPRHYIVQWFDNSRTDIEIHESEHAVL